MNNKGFVLAETLVVTIFVLVTFTVLYESSIPLLGRYKQLSLYDDLDTTYEVYQYKKILESDLNYESIVANNYKIITCSDFRTSNLCDELDSIIGTNNTLLYFNSNSINLVKADNNISSEIKDYLEYINVDNDKKILLLESDENISYIELTKGVNSDDMVCNIGENLANCIIRLYNSNSNPYLWKSGLNNDDNTYRFIKKNLGEPNNYICFGTKTDCLNNKYLYRIIGVFDGKTKIISKSSIGKYVWYGDNIDSNHDCTEEKNQYNDSNIKNKLNKFIDDNYQEYINESEFKKWSDLLVKYKVDLSCNGINRIDSRKNAQSILNYDLPFGSEGHLTDEYFSFPIALSDLLLSLGNTSLNYYNNYNDIKKSWLFLGSNEWSFARFNSAHAIVVGSNGKLCSNWANVDSSLKNYCDTSGYIKIYTYDVRENLLLDSQTLYCGGHGTSTDPIIIGYKDCN